MTNTGTDREETHVLRVIREEQNHNRPFEAYLEQAHLSFLDVALEARVRVLTVWNIAHNIPVRETHALSVRVALQRLTGVPYIGFIAILPPEEL